MAGMDVADVVVIGGGGSGLAAAIEAARLGREVVVLEKNPTLGGSTGMAIGSYTANNTPHQKRAGILDSADDHFEDLGRQAGARAGRDNLALRRILVDNTSDTFLWLQSLGLVFLGPMPEPPHRVPRMHNVVPSSKAYPYHLARECRRSGVALRMSMPAKSLVTENGRVTGVTCEGAVGEDHFFRARHGVVIASGDFSASRHLKSRFTTDIAASCDAVNNTNTGDGHQLAMTLGSSVVNGDLIHGPIMRFVPPATLSLPQRLPPYGWIAQVSVMAMKYMPSFVLRPLLMSFITTALGPERSLFEAGAILINQTGERFTDELATPALDVQRQPNGLAYIIIDSVIAKKFTRWPHFISTAPSVSYAYLPDYRRNRKDVYNHGASVAELARALRIPHGRLETTIAEARPTFVPPFVALGPVKSYIVVTDGGLNVNDRHQVLGSDGLPIPGLYAAGSAGQGGLLLDGHGHRLAWAFVSGRRAGRHAASSASVD